MSAKALKLLGATADEVRFERAYVLSSDKPQTPTDGARVYVECVLDEVSGDYGGADADADGGAEPMGKVQKLLGSPTEPPVTWLKRHPSQAGRVLRSKALKTLGTTIDDVRIEKALLVLGEAPGREVPAGRLPRPRRPRVNAWAVVPPRSEGPSEGLSVFLVAFLPWGVLAPLNVLKLQLNKVSPGAHLWVPFETEQCQAACGAEEPRTRSSNPSARPVLSAPPKPPLRHALHAVSVVQVRRRAHLPCISPASHLHLGCISGVQVRRRAHVGDALLGDAVCQRGGEPLPALPSREGARAARHLAQARGGDHPPQGVCERRHLLADRPVRRLDRVGVRGPLHPRAAEAVTPERRLRGRLVARGAGAVAAAGGRALGTRRAGVATWRACRGPQRTSPSLRRCVCGLRLVVATGMRACRVSCHLCELHLSCVGVNHSLSHSLSLLSLQASPQLSLTRSLRLTGLSLSLRISLHSSKNVLLYKRGDTDRRRGVSRRVSKVYSRQHPQSEGQTAVTGDGLQTTADSSPQPAVLHHVAAQGCVDDEHAEQYSLMSKQQEYQRVVDKRSEIVRYNRFRSRITGNRASAEL